jgi:hypothetical protein
MEPPDPPKARSPKPARKGRSQGEQRVATLLLGLGLLTEEEKWWHECRDKGPLRFDFFVLVNGRAGVIEVDGRQHFEVVPDLGVDEEALAVIRRHDVQKNRFLKDRGISLLRVAHSDHALLEKWVTDFLARLRKENEPIYVYSNASLYTNPYGLQPSTCTLG